MSAEARMEKFKDQAMPLMDKPGYRKPVGFGIYRAQRSDHDVIAVQFALINWGCNALSAAVMMHGLGVLNSRLSGPELTHPISSENVEAMYRMYEPIAVDACGDAHKNVQLITELGLVSNEKLEDIYVTFLFEDQPVESLTAAYLKLGAISTRQAKASELNLQGVQDVMPNLGWCDGQPYDLAALTYEGFMGVVHDAFPTMDYTSPLPQLSDRLHITDPTVTLASSANVSYGSAIGSCTHVEGTIGLHNGLPVSVGNDCHIQTHASTQIHLGDHCTVESGVHLHPDTTVFVDNPDTISRNNQGQLKTPGDARAGRGFAVSARQLQGFKQLHFKQAGHSNNGIQVISRQPNRMVPKSVLPTSANPALIMP